MAAKTTHRMVHVNAKNVRPGDFYMEAVVNEVPSGTFGVVKEIGEEIQGSGFFKVLLENGETVYLFENDKVSVEREYRR